MNLAVSQEMVFEVNSSTVSVSFPVERDRIYTFVLYSPGNHPATIQYQPDGGILYEQQISTTTPGLIALSAAQVGSMSISFNRPDTTAEEQVYVLVSKEVSL